MDLENIWLGEVLNGRKEIKGWLLIYTIYGLLFTISLSVHKSKT